ncbi:MAG: hypothetical protein ACUVSY_07920 [Roseiflexus sp.]
MNNALKMALVVGVAIAVETFVLRRLFLSAPMGVFVGAFLIASLLLIFIQHLLAKRWLTHSASVSRRQAQSEPVSSIDPGLDSPSIPVFHSIDTPERNGALPEDEALPEQERDGALPEQKQHAASSDEDGII